MIKVGIVGSTGYAGSELVRLILEHPQADLVKATSHSYEKLSYSEIYQNYRHVENVICEEENIEEMAEVCDVIFLALPHGIASGKVTEKILEKTKIIDLGADFRLKDMNIYSEWYNTEHLAKGLIAEAVYGLSEINKLEIAKARLVANPGCYTTCGILSLIPLVAKGVIALDSIIIDAKSGMSGGGRALSLGTHFSEANESTKAYKVASHRHTPEIEEQLSYAANSEIKLTFTPHLVPMNRGILSTSYAKLNSDYTYEDIRKIFAEFYADSYFIRLTKENVFPETKWVKGSNFMDIGFAIDKRTNRIVVVGALDNLTKGASGQAVQNMNIMFGIDERTGLMQIPIFPV